MADLSNPLTQVIVGQAQPAVPVNNLIDALSPAAIFGQNDLTTSGLTWGYYGGRYRGIAIAHGTIALPASQANVYIVAAKSTGVVSQSTSSTNWNDATNYDRLYLAITGASTITDWDDYREVVSSAGAGVATIDTETIQDIVGALIAAGSNTTVTYNDAFSPPTLVIDSTGGGGGSSLTQEQVEDIIASLITAGSGISKQYNDGDSPATLVITNTNSSTSIPQNSQSADYTLVIGDANGHIYHPSADTTPRTWTIPANSSVAFTIGTGITFVNDDLGGTITIAITTDSMRLAGPGTSGSRTLAANGIATALKITSTSWIINGTNLT